MRLIAAGFARTGTTSLARALTILLDGPCLHMQAVFGDPEACRAWARQVHHADPQVEAELIAGYASCAGFPGALQLESLARRFPRAPVVLSVRDEASWLRSWRELERRMQMGAPLAGRSPRFAALLELFAAFRSAAFGSGDDDDALVAGYRRHNARVRETIEPARLVEYRIEDGWDPLCECLALPVPSRAFPHENRRGASFRHIGRELFAR